MRTGSNDGSIIKTLSGPAAQEVRRKKFMSSLSAVTLLVLLFSIVTPTPTDAFIGGAFQKVQKDYASLTRRVTARHILVSDEKIAQVLKQKIRNECIEKELFVIDTFEEAAKKYSRDDTTNFRGGLLGELVPQGKKKKDEINNMD